jgi:hypothetical protein
VSWRRRRRTPDQGLDRDLEELRAHEDRALDALRLVRERLGLGIDDAFERVRRHPSWSDVTLRRELDDRQDQLVLQTATVDGLVVLKAYCHDESSFDPPEQDDYRWFQYEVDVDGRVYEVRNYVDDDEASISRWVGGVRDEDAARIARFLIEHEGVRRVTRISTKTGGYTRVVALGPGWSGLDALILLVLRDGPVLLRDLGSTVEKLDSVAPDPQEVESSRTRLGAAGLAHDDGDALRLSDEGRALVGTVAGGQFWGEWLQLEETLRRLPLPESG